MILFWWLWRKLTRRYTRCDVCGYRYRGNEAEWRWSEKHRAYSGEDLPL